MNTSAGLKIWGNGHFMGKVFPGKLPWDIFMTSILLNYAKNPNEEVIQYIIKISNYEFYREAIFL